MNVLTILMDGSFQNLSPTREIVRAHAGTTTRPDDSKASPPEGAPPGSGCVLLTYALLFSFLSTAARLDRGDLAAAEPLCAQQRSQVTDKSTRGSEKVLLDLSRKETYVLLAVNANPRNVLITDVEVSGLPTSYQLVPASGDVRLGHPLDIELKEPANVRIRLAVVKRGKELALRVSPQIVLGRGSTIDLTRNRITRTARNLRRHVKDLNQQLAALARERQTMNAWLLSPGNKPFDTVKAVHMRMKLLDQAIKSQRRAVPAAQRQCVALGQAAEFIEKLHKNVEIQYTVKVVEPRVARFQSGN